MAASARNHHRLRLRDECSTGTKANSWIIRTSLRLGNRVIFDAKQKKAPNLVGATNTENLRCAPNPACRLLSDPPGRGRRAPTGARMPRRVPVSPTRNVDVHALRARYAEINSMKERLYKTLPKCTSVEHVANCAPGCAATFNIVNDVLNLFCRASPSAL
jgi:hypothetical protein